MADRYLLIYLFCTFVVGIACLGAIIITARRQPDGLARPFLFLYTAFSVFVMAALARSFVSTLEPTPTGLLFAVEYAESFIGRYGVMFSFPFFVHRLFGVTGGARDRALFAITLITVIGQHLTEFGFGGRWDDVGDVFEDIVFAGVFAYVLWVGFSARKRNAASRLANTFLVLAVLGLPGITYDLFLRSDTAWRFYPLWYGIVSVCMTVSLVRRQPDGGIPVEWGLTDREQEVVRLVQRGLSNKAIARELAISSNTVKSHLSAVFDKSGIRTRVGLIAGLSAGAPE